MKRIGKLFLFVMLITLAIGSVLATVSFAREERTISVAGAERVHVDFTGVVYDCHVNEDGGIGADPKTTIGKLSLFEAVSKKYGHLRTVCTPDGNTVLDLTFHADYSGKLASANDIVVSAVPEKRTLEDIEYFVVEFDMTSRTDYPGAICVLMETRVFDSDLYAEISKDYRRRTSLGSYSAEKKAWSFGEDTLSLKRGEWAHITIVTELCSATKVTTEGVSVNYSGSRANVYVNGEYKTTAYPFPDVELDPSDVPVLHYAGVGYGYGEAHLGQKAGDSITLDNCTYTTFNSEYKANAADDRLAALFSDETPTPGVTDLGEEILYTSEYGFPDAPALASYRTENGEEVACADFATALEQIKKEGKVNATIKLYANQYRKAIIDYPVTVEMNGFALQNGWEVDKAFAVEYDGDQGVFRVLDNPERQATVQYYNEPYGTDASVALTKKYASGAEFVFSDFDAIAPAVFVDGKSGMAPTGEFVVYDEQGQTVELSQITQQNLGKTYRAYPVYEKVTLDDSICFYTIVNGKVRFFCENDLWAAANDEKQEQIRDDEEQTVSVVYPKAMPDDAKIVLVTDCIVSQPLYTLFGNLTVDLAGHTLLAQTAFATTGAQSVTSVLTKTDTTVTTSSSYFVCNMQIFVYSSAPFGKLDVETNDLLMANFDIDSSNGVDFFFGYESESVKSPEPITVCLGARLALVQKGSLQSVHFANATVQSRGTDGKGWIVNAQSRGHSFYFEDCEIFLENHLVASSANNASKEVYFKNSSIYGNGKNNISYLVDHGADTPEKANAATTGGIITVSLENSKIYNMNFGQARIQGYHKASAEATPVLQLTETRLTMDLTSQISCEPLNLTSTYEGKRLLAKPSTKTVDGITYTSVYCWTEDVTKYATFHIYDVPFDQLGVDSQPVATQQVAIGYWYAMTLDPTGESFYEYEKDPLSLILPTGYAVYDAEGRVVDQTVLSDADADAVYSVCISYDKVPIAFNIRYSDGSYAAFVTNDIGAALGTKLLNNVNSCVLPEGATVTLYADCTTSGVLVGYNSYVDLNGYTLYSERKLTSFSALANQALYVYSSRAGARICQTPTSESGSAYVAEAKYANSKIYFGYENATKRSEHRIEVFCGAFAEIRGAQSEVYLSSLTVCANGRDNYGFLNIRSGTDTSRSFLLLDCEIYSNRGGFFSIREESASGTLTMKNTNIYSTASAALFSWYERRTEEIRASIYMENSGLWGAVTLGGLKNGLGIATLYVSGESTVSALTENVVLLDANKSFVPRLPTVTLDGIQAPASGIYGNAERVLFRGTLSSGYTVGTQDDFKSSVYVNISMDTNVVINFYVPAVSALSAVLFGEKDLLDTKRIETIDGKKFYVISLESAPKLGDKELTLCVRMKDGTALDFTLSVARYAEKLFALEAKEGTYLSDAQNLMKYILTYIKEVAVKYGDADEKQIFASLGDFSIDTDVKITEPVYNTDSIKSYVTHAALDLDAYAGFAFKVAEGFVGTVELELSGVSAVSKTYTKDAPAVAGSTVVLENVPVHIFRGDVVITVTTATGEVVKASFNLATYAAAYPEAYVKALYAYSIAAKAYNAKYPTVSTVK